MPKTKSSKRGSKRGAPVGNQNARKGNRRRTRKGGTVIVMSEAAAGSETDPVMAGFATKEERLRAEYEDQMQGIEAARNAYKASLGNAKMLGAGERATTPVTIKLTRKGTPDLRNRTTREFISTHPSWTPGQVPARAD
jgi:hypothetical protein